MRIVFMGTPEISVGTLKRIIADGHEVLAVVTQPDRPKGRGKKMVMSPVKELALENNIEVLQPEKASNPDFIDKLTALEPDLIVVVAYGQILRKSLLDIPKKGCVNVHVSLLPKLRGAAPINWAIINGDRKTGVTTMFMDEGLDTGDIIMSKEFELDDEITAGELHDWMMIEGANLLSKTVEAIESDNYTRTKQNDEEFTYAPMMSKDLGHIDFSKSAKEIHNLVRGTIPWPGAWCESSYGKMKIWKTKVINKTHSFEYGKVLKVDKEGIEVACGKDILLIVDMQMPNKKRMPVAEFIKGNSIEEGTILK